MQDDVLSKTKRKKEMLELQALGARLAGLSEARLEAMILPAALAQAVLDARKIRSHEARRRQLQYIGRLMRETDPEPIRAQLAAIDGTSAQAAAQHRRLEAWRERLLADDAALTEFAAAHPQADVQVLRTLIRNSRKEQKEGRAPRAYRELFRLLKSLGPAAPVPR